MAKAKRKLSAYNRFIAKELRGKKGGTKAQRAARFKAAVAKWKRGRGKSKPRKKAVSRHAASRPRARAKPKSTGGRKMAKFNTQKVFKYLRLAALVLPAAERAMGPGSNAQKINLVKRDYFGIGSDGNFYPHLMAKGWVPYLASIVATYGIPKIAGILRGL